MKRASPQLKSVYTVLSFLFALALWVVFSPRAVGGLASYVVIVGQSMEPDYVYGDLIITHRAREYEVGDAVAYHNAESESGIVYHRIIAVENNKFILQGDNNSWKDSFHPIQDEILGKEWLHLPGAGKIIQIIRSPGMFAGFVTALVSMVYFSYFRSKSSDARKRGKRQRKRNDKGGSPVSFSNERVLETLSILFILFLGAIFLVIVSFSRPLNIDLIATVDVQMYGHFSYEAETESGVYDEQLAQTGQPVFRLASDAMTVNFDYQINNVERVNGITKMLLVIRDETGWSRTLVLQGEESFSGPEGRVQGVIDFREVDHVINEFERKTGVSRRQYILTVIPTVQTSIIQNAFSPSFSFGFDELQVTPFVDGEAAFTPSETFGLPYSEAMMNEVSLLGVDIKVKTVRILSIIALVILLGAGGLLYWTSSRRSHSTQVARIAYEHKDRLISVARLRALEGATEVSTFADLLRVANRYEVDILHFQVGDEHTYAVQLVEGDYYVRLVDEVEPGRVLDEDEIDLDVT